MIWSKPRSHLFFKCARKMTHFIVNCIGRLCDNHAVIFLRFNDSIQTYSHSAQGLARSAGTDERGHATGGDFERRIAQLVGRRFRIGSVECLGMELCEPCSKLARLVDRRVLPNLVHRAGLRAAILSAGSIVPGDTLQLL